MNAPPTNVAAAAPVTAAPQPTSPGFFSKAASVIGTGVQTIVNKADQHKGKIALLSSKFGADPTKVYGAIGKAKNVKNTAASMVGGKKRRRTTRKRRNSRRTSRRRN